jgi:PLP dependent protein
VPIAENIRLLRSQLPEGVRLVAVSKTQSPETILEAYNAGQRVFGENKVQELLSKCQNMPSDIEWHLIGHLQTNKVKSLLPFVSMIESVDSLRLLSEINRQAERIGKIIPCLLQFHIATEESKFGLDINEAISLLTSEEYHELTHIRIDGVMGMASFSDDQSLVRQEFLNLKSIFHTLKERFFENNLHFSEISMGMSGDYQIAIEAGSTNVRIGSLLFGARIIT